MQENQETPREARARLVVKFGVGDRVRAFHPFRLGVVDYGTVVSIGRVHCRIDFGPLLGGVVRTRIMDVLEVVA